MKIKFYHHDIEKFIKKLEKLTIAKVLRTFDLLEQFGQNLKMPHSKKIAKGVFELRVRGVQEVRFLYLFHKDQIIIVVHGFVKKTKQILRKDIELAISRRKKLDLI